MSSHNNDLFTHHLALLAALYDHCQGQPPFNTADASDTDLELLHTIKQLANATQRDDNFTELGQQALARIVANYPHITPAVNRDLFWFFGGDCLHYMSDEELKLYQRLDELIYQEQQTGNEVLFAAAKASIFQLH